MNFPLAFALASTAHLYVPLEAHARPLTLRLPMNILLAFALASTAHLYVPLEAHAKPLTLKATNEFPE